MSLTPQQLLDKGHHRNELESFNGSKLESWLTSIKEDIRIQCHHLLIELLKSRDDSGVLGFTFFCQRKMWLHDTFDPRICTIQDFKKIPNPGSP